MKILMTAKLLLWSTLVAASAAHLKAEDARDVQ